MRFAAFRRSVVESGAVCVCHPVVIVDELTLKICWSAVGRTAWTLTSALVSAHVSVYFSGYRVLVSSENFTQFCF